MGTWKEIDGKMAKRKVAEQVSKEKAKEILKDDSVSGKPLTKSQKGFFGVAAGGKKPTNLGE